MAEPLIGGYRQDLEDYEFLRDNAQYSDQFCFGDIDPRSLGKPMGLSKIIRKEDQSQMNSCAGNSGSTIFEAGLYHQSKHTILLQLSRMWAYIKGQEKSGIRGDNGATLAGVLQALSEGCPLEEFAPYTNEYYTHFSREAIEDAPKRKIKSWAEVKTVQEVYEGLAKRVGGLYLGIPWTGECSNPNNGRIDYYRGMRVGGHAICVLDWCEETAKDGRPYLDLFNSHSKRYGIDGNAHVHPDALQQMLDCPLTTAFFVSDMEFIAPRFKLKDSQWF